MKISIDQEEFIECGACEDACSEVFALESGEKASIVKRYQTKGPAEGEVGGDLSNCVQEAADGCPAGVINVA